MTDSVLAVALLSPMFTPIYAPNLSSLIIWQTSSGDIIICQTICEYIYFGKQLLFLVSALPTRVYG